MDFTRIDDIDELGNLRVIYTLSSQPGYDFKILATKLGVQLSGLSPKYTDYTAVNRHLVFAQYQSQKLRETGHAIPQPVLDRGEL